MKKSVKQQMKWLEIDCQKGTNRKIEFDKFFKNDIIFIDGALF